MERGVKQLFGQKEILIAGILFFVGYLGVEASWDASALSSSESWLIRDMKDESSDGETALGVGRVVGISQKSVEVENDLIGGADSYPRLTTIGAVLTPPVDPEEASLLCEAICSKNGAKDYIWFHNGDETSCDIIELNRRFLIFRAFGVVIKTPRYRVKALRFGR